MRIKILFYILVAGFISFQDTSAQTAMINVQGRKVTCLNGRWNVIIDASDAGIGDWMAVYKDRKPKNKTEFVEYSFEGGQVLNVPGDFNSQLPELNYYESTVWYKRTFAYRRNKDKRLFIHFGAVNYKADIFINSKKAGSHEGGFTPFQFEITELVNDSINSIIVRTNNQRVKDGIPGLGFDWFNYGGITRDVNLIETPASFIEDYFIQLEKGSVNKVKGWVKINGIQKSKQVNIQIPEAKVNVKATVNSEGIAAVEFSAPFILWSPAQPKLYKVTIFSDSDTIQDEIGFRSIEVKGTEILLNGKSVFLKGVNIHEEVPQRRSRAFSESDALMLLSWAKELGCNFVRLAHYPHNENMVRLADHLGLMVWEEIPVYQNVDFADQKMQNKMNLMLREMVGRDKNRCSTIIWSMSNETYPSKERNEAITNLVGVCRSIDPTRLITSAFVNVQYQGNTATITDTLNKIMDVISINEYFGWYKPWPFDPENMVWISNFNKPLIMSEFGGEALYGNNAEPKDAASSWSEEYQEQIYKDQIKMLKKIPFLRGTCPWILADFRSPVRLNPAFQQGWNRKGLISDRGDKKKSWYIMKAFYQER